VLKEGAFVALAKPDDIRKQHITIVVALAKPGDVFSKVKPNNM
jgi:hypothetical protein